MRYVSALALLLVSWSAVHASGGLSEHVDAIRGAEPQKLATAMEKAAKALRGQEELPAAERTACSALLAEARSASEAKDKNTVAAAWKLANASVAALQTPDPSYAAWLLEHVNDSWKARANETTARAALRAAVAVVYDESVKSDRSIRAAKSAVKKAMRAKGEPALFVSLAIGLASVRAKSARKLLGKSLPRKGLHEKDLAAIMRTLGEAGGVSAVPVLLDHVPDTPAVVLEEVLVALFSLERDVLRKEGKKILGVTIEATEAPTHEARALNGKSKLTPKELARKELLEARRAAWATERLVDTPPRELPPGGSGIRGVTALYWKVVDALDGRIRPPEPAKNVHFKFVNGRPNLGAWGWQQWWRGAR